MRDETVGVYIHVPFCERVCPYCDFAVVAAPRLAPEREARVVDALERELALRRTLYAGRRLETVYLGGGTPALLRPDSVARLVGAARRAFPDAEPAEITLEVNPSSVERSRLPGFRAAGVNRLSLGIQSFDDATLKVLGRAHRGEEGPRSFAAAREAGFENLSVDLMLGAPGQDRAGVRADVARALELRPEHVSVYALTVESGTPYARAVERGQLRLPEDDRVAEMLEDARDLLRAAGLERYEISSYARPGREALHNRRYWERRPVLGVGVGAWSSEPPREDAPHGARRANPRELARWLERIEAGQPASEAPPERLPPQAARGEAAFLALRTTRGLDASRFVEEFGAAPRAHWGEAIDALCAAGLLEESPGGDLRLTEAGVLLSDGVFEHFVAEPSAR